MLLSLPTTGHAFFHFETKDKNFQLRENIFAISIDLISTSIKMLILVQHVFDFEKL